MIGSQHPFCCLFVGVWSGGQGEASVRGTEYRVPPLRTQLVGGRQRADSRRWATRCRGFCCLLPSFVVMRAYARWLCERDAWCVMRERVLFAYRAAPYGVSAAFLGGCTRKVGAPAGP